MDVGVFIQIGKQELCPDAEDLWVAQLIVLASHLPILIESVNRPKQLSTAAHIYSLGLCLMSVGVMSVRVIG